MCIKFRKAEAPWLACLLLRIIILVGMRRAEHKPLRISYGAGAHNEGARLLALDNFRSQKIYAFLLKGTAPIF